MSTGLTVRDLAIGGVMGRLRSQLHGTEQNNTNTNRARVVFIPTFESSPLLEATGLGILRAQLKAGGRWQAVMEHGGAATLDIMLGDYMENVQIGLSCNLAGAFSRGCSSPEMKGWFNNRQIKDPFPRKVEEFNRTGNLPEELVHPFEARYYTSLHEGGVQVALEPKIDYESWIKEIRALGYLVAGIPQDYAQGRIEGGCTGIFGLMHNYLGELTEAGTARDERVAKICQHATVLDGRNVFVVRGASHAATLIPALIAKGLAVDFNLQAYRDVMFAALSPFDLAYLAHFSGIGKEALEQLFLQHIGYSILISDLDTKDWDLEDWAEFRQFAFSVPTEAIRFQSQALKPKYVHDHSYLYVDFKRGLLESLRSAGIESTTIIGTGPEPLRLESRER